MSAAQRNPMVHNRSLLRALVACAIVLYVALAVGTSLTRRPWSDEGWFASPAYELVTTGAMATRVIEPTGSNLTVQKPGVVLSGINERTYWIMPLHVLAQAAWYQVVGFSFFSLRALSTLWGLVALLSWFVIVRSLAGDDRPAFLAVALIGLDYVFILTAAFGRMDMMSAALNAAAVAAYLHFRPHRLTLAVAASQTLVVASGLTHPNALLGLADVLFMALYFDRARFGLRHLPAAAAPYVFGAVCYGLYVLQSPADFFIQFGANGGQSRFENLAAPLTAIWLEITDRYLSAYGGDAGSSGLARLKILILLAYAVGIAGALAVRDIRRHRGCRALLALVALHAGFLTFFNYKLVIYMIHVVPVLAAVAAVVAYHWWEAGRMRARLALLGVCGLVALQAAWTAYGIYQNWYGRKYVPTVAYLKERAAGASLIVGTAELGIGLGFPANFVDDLQLGYRSGRLPDVVVMSPIYDESIESYRDTQPEVYRHVNSILEESEPVFDNGHYRIYAVRAPRALD